MSDPFPRPDRPLDRAIRARLDADARAAVADRLLARVRARLDADAVTSAGRNRRRLLTVAGALAASILIAVFLLIPSGTAQASPREVVEQAKAEHEGPADRCYEVSYELPAGWKNLSPWLNSDQPSRLWTRGDRYVTELAGGRRAWGRDEQGRVWIAPSPYAAARFGPDEVPEALKNFFDVRAVRLPQVLDEFLKECDLTARPDDNKSIRRIAAVPRTDVRTALHRAEVDVNPKSNAVERLMIEHQLPAGTAAVTFRRVAADPPAESVYRPEGHLKEGAPVFDRAQPLRRLGVLARHFGAPNGEKKKSSD
jgi:hypothetical protein